MRGEGVRGWRGGRREREGERKEGEETVSQSSVYIFVCDMIHVHSSVLSASPPTLTYVHLIPVMVAYGVHKCLVFCL